MWLPLIVALVAAQGAPARPFSLLVSPLELSEAPPRTRAVAAVRIAGAEAEAASSRVEQLARADEREFCALARLRASKPTADAGGMLGTVWPGLVSGEIGGALLELEVGGVARVAAADGGWIVVRRLERDAACRQVFVAGTDPRARAEADVIARELRAGADFARVARERSDDKASALRGGDLAIYERGPADALLREAAFLARPGEIVGPIESPLGFHVLQRVPVAGLDPRLRDDAWARARGILVAFGGAHGSHPTLEREHDEAERIANDLAARIRRGEDMAALAREHDDDRGGRERAGDLGWIRRGVSAAPPFFDRLFVEPHGTLIGPIASSAGYVLLRREDPPRRSRIELRKSAFASLVCWTLAGSSAAPSSALPEWMRPALEAARAIAEPEVSDYLREQIEAALATAESASDLAAAVPGMRMPFDGGFREIDPDRECVLGFARALSTVESRYRSEVWPTHERAIDEALAEIRPRLVPLGEAALDEILRDLALEDPRIVVSIVLVPASAGRSFGCAAGTPGVADVGAHRGSRALEAILHGATHQLEAAAGRDDSPLDRLVFVDESGRLERDDSELLVQVEAASVVRRVFDPAHPLDAPGAGDPRGLAAVRGPWLEHLAGEIDLETAIERIRANLRAR